MTRVRGRAPIRLSFACSLTFTLALTLVVGAAPFVLAASSEIAGSYRCVSQNVGGAAGRCTSPPLILNVDGTYQMSSEHGSYRIAGNRLYLSESRLRGAGLISGNDLIFEYSYRGLNQTVTYRRQPQGNDSSISQNQSQNGNAAGSVPVLLKIDFDRPDGWIGWVNTAKLVPLGGDSGDTLMGMAVATSRQSLRVSFRAVPSGRRYEVQLGSGTANYAVATLDIRRTHQPVELAISAKIPGNRQLR
ncbi:MAG: hypothetical protein LAO23_19145 [Acidobacteriia bacterium]|nr:hypothetical protein [Terriglobia bacterium]